MWDYVYRRLRRVWTRCLYDDNVSSLLRLVYSITQAELPCPRTITFAFSILLCMSKACITDDQWIRGKHSSPFMKAEKYIVEMATFLMPF